MTNKHEEIPMAIETIEVQSVSVTEAQSRAEIDIQVATAKKYPRNIKRAVDNSIALISQDKDFAKTCIYSLPRAGKQIQGASVHLARLLAAEYKNLRVDSKIVEIGDTMVTAQSVALDLENNFAIRTEVKRRITDKSGQRYSDDMITVTCNAALSIAARNAILQVIPAAAVNIVYKSASRTVLGDMSSEQKLVKRRKEVLDGFQNTYNVTEEEILKVLELETINQIKEEQILSLIGLGQAIKDGDTTVAEAFGRNVEHITQETKQKVDEAIKKAQDRRNGNKDNKLNL